MLRVIKVGGSLLDWPELPERLWRWLQRQPAAENVLMAGGGELCDVVRRWDGRFALGEELCHALCLDALSISSVLLERLVVAARERYAAIVPDRQLSIRIVDWRDYQANCPLPHTWQVTSDSLAAYVAEAKGAMELVLLKSASLSESMSCDEAARMGYVDEYFSVAAAARVPRIRAVNLRGDAEAEWYLATGERET